MHNLPSLKGRQARRYVAEMKQYYFTLMHSNTVCSSRLFSRALLLLVFFTLQAAPSELGAADQTKAPRIDCTSFLIRRELTPPAWDSDYFSPSLVKDESRARRLVDIVNDNEIARWETHRFLSSLTGISESAGKSVKQLLDDHAPVRKLYYSLRDNVTPYSSRFTELAQFVHDNLPARGLIADFGAGTGTMSTALILAAPQRSLIAVDLSSERLLLAESKLRFIRYRYVVNQGHALTQMDLTEEGAETLGVSLSGAVMNDVLNTIPPPDRLRVLNGIYASLLPGASFILCDPNAHRLANNQQLRDRLMTETLSAVENNNRLTEFEFALNAYIELELIKERAPLFLTTQEVEQLFTLARFRMTSSRVEFEHSTCWLLQKPQN